MKGGENMNRLGKAGNIGVAFIFDTAEEIEEAVNGWLEDYYDLVILDIQYRPTVPEQEASENVMIVYRRED